MSGLYDTLTAEEGKKLRELTGNKFDDPIVEIQVMLAIRPLPTNRGIATDTGEMLSGKSLSELAEGNTEVAKLLITAIDRSSGLKKGQITESYVFDNKDPREDEMQRKLIPSMVKSIRERTGLSQKAFAEKYDISLGSLEAWETGRKKMSKYAYSYLKGSLYEDIKSIEKINTITIPFEILDEEGVDYIVKCSEASDDEICDYPYVRELKPRNEMEGSEYVLELDRGVEVEDGKEVLAINRYDCPASVKECLNTAIKYDSDVIRFSFYGDCGFSEKTTVRERLDVYLSGEYLDIGM